MQHIHIRSLEKYHPGYKDRKLQWAKMFFNMVNGDPEFEVIADEIDKWRFVAMICLELNAQKPLINSDKYWEKHFDIKKRPMALTLQMLHNFISSVEICNVDKDKDKEYKEDKEKEEEKDNNSKKSPYWAAFSTKTQELLKTVSKDFNIYAMLGRLKKQTKNKVELPEPVVIAVCQSFLEQKGAIRHHWAWFKDVIPRIAQDVQHEEHKNAPVAQSIKNILAGMR